MSAIEARDLTKIYRTYRKEGGLWGAVKGLVRRRYDETRAADAVTFQIEEGELVGFLGPNGAGKTTVLKMLSGVLNPTSGDARVLGFVPWERRNEMKRQFSLLMGQKNALWWDLPAQESLELNRAIYGIDRARFNNEEPRIVTMLTSHYMQDIEELCPRVIILDHGKIFFDGPLTSIIDRFSGYKILSLTFENQAIRDFSEFGQVIEQTPVSVQLKVPRARVTETCRQLLEACSVSDINVQELPVEEVIRQLFGQRHESERVAAAASAESSAPVT